MQPDVSKITVVNVVSGEIVAVLPTGDGAVALCCNTRDDKVYCANRTSNSVTVIDGMSDSVITTVQVFINPSILAYSSLANKVYVGCNPDTYSLKKLYVLDGATNQVRATFSFDGGHGWCGLACNTNVNKAYYFYDAHSFQSHMVVVDGESDTMIVQVPVTYGAFPACLNPRASKLYCGTCDGGGGNITVIDAGRDSVVKFLHVNAYNPRALCANPVDNKTYCADYATAIFVVDGMTDTVTAEIPVTGHRVWCFNSTDDRLYVGQDQPLTVTVVDGAGDSVLTCLSTLGALPVALAYNTLRNKVYCANEHTGTVTIIDGATNVPRAFVPVGRNPRALLYSPVADKVYCANYSSDSVAAISGTGDSVTASVGTGLRPVALACDSATGKVYVANYAGQSVTVADSALQGVLATIPVGRYPVALCPDATRHRMYCANSGAASVSVVDTRTDSVTATTPVGNLPSALCLGMSANKLYCANKLDGTVSVIACESLRVTKTLSVGARPCALCYDPPDEKVYVANAGGGVTVIDASGDIVIGTLRSTMDFSAVEYASLNGRVYCTGNDSVMVLAGVSDSIVRVLGVGHAPTSLAWDQPEGRMYVANCSSATISVIRDSLLGLEEEPGRKPERRFGPSLVRGTLSLAGMAAAALIDASGQKVLYLRPGANDITRLPAGVYFICPTGPSVNARRSPASKVVIQR
jgi:YVTN family beta-propeller protein